MFIDEARVYVKGGDGGNGIVAFRRENTSPREVRPEATAGEAAMWYLWPMKA